METRLPVIQGLTYIATFLTKNHQQTLFKKLLSSFFTSSSTNDTNTTPQNQWQFFGRKTFPPELLALIECVESELNFENPLPLPEYFTQIILNYYTPGQGIANHVDLPHRYEDVIAIVSLGSGITMDLVNGEDERELYLEPGSLLVLRDEARWVWKHGITARMEDNGVPRDIRISITMRRMKEDAGVLIEQA